MSTSWPKWTRCQVGWLTCGGQQSSGARRGWLCGSAHAIHPHRPSLSPVAVSAVCTSSDPCCAGLLHMSLLERCVYLLTTARTAAAVDPLLSILIRCAVAACKCALLCNCL